MGHPKRPATIDARITEEYVICGICLTKNRVVFHKKVLRPVWLSPARSLWVTTQGPPVR